MISFSSHLLELIASVPPGRLTKQKMMTVDDIVHSQLFKMPECRGVLLPGFTIRIKELLESREEVGLGLSKRCMVLKALVVEKYLVFGMISVHNFFFLTSM